MTVGQSPRKRLARHRLPICHETYSELFSDQYTQVEHWSLFSDVRRITRHWHLVTRSLWTSAVGSVTRCLGESRLSSTPMSVRSLVYVCITIVADLEKYVGDLNVSVGQGCVTAVSLMPLLPRHLRRLPLLLPLAFSQFVPPVRASRLPRGLFARASSLARRVHSAYCILSTFESMGVPHWHTI